MRAAVAFEAFSPTPLAPPGPRPGGELSFLGDFFLACACPFFALPAVLGFEGRRSSAGGCLPAACTFLGWPAAAAATAMAPATAVQYVQQ